MNLMHHIKYENISSGGRIEHSILYIFLEKQYVALRNMLNEFP